MINALREQFADVPLLPSIPLSVKGAESTAERISILQYMPKSTVAEAYREVGSWLEAMTADASSTAVIRND
jgi:chromosome partitioning protein